MMTRSHASPEAPVGSLPAPPRLISGVLSWRPLELAARLALASAFLISGIAKLLDFESARVEVAALGFGASALVAAAVIATQLGGSALFLSRRWCWLGAGILAGFTIAATLIAHPFWNFEGPERARQAATFFEHLGLVGGFVVAAILAHRGEPKR